MYNDDEGEDEEKALQEALLLSQQPDKPVAADAAKAEDKKEPEIKPAEDVNIDDDLMNEVINELGIEGVDANELNKMVDEKKDGDKKDGKDKDKK
jgi:hypothetical protein